MKTRLSEVGLVLFFVTAFLFVGCSATVFEAPSPENQTACVLNFTSFPYQPQGECIDIPRKIKEWASYPTSLCCRNALTVLSKALALQASTLGEGNIFIEENQWRNCSGPFRRQPSVSIQTCGFSHLFHGSSHCSGLSLQNMTSDSIFLQAANNCSQFGYNFNEHCQNCTAAIIKARDHFAASGNSTEKAICVVAVVISIAATRMNDLSFVDDLYRCMPALDAYVAVVEYSNKVQLSSYTNATNSYRTGQMDCPKPTVQNPNSHVVHPGYIKLKYSLVVALLTVVLAATGLIMVIMLIKYVTKNKKQNSKQLKRKEISTWSGLYRFSKAEIENAINFGNERKCLGRGSAGQVYKGILPSGQVVAIKQIYKNNNSDTFTREVENLSRVRHPNLVCLFGCCIEDGEQYLVYEYCSAGNLAQHLLRKDTFLTWERRVKILRYCSLALRYLHHYIDGCIVHRDIKLTNILLTEKLEPKLSDFGLAKMLGMEESKVFTDVRGTLGYMDPEYMSNAKLTCASDIYSFGIVALQLLSGQKVIELDLDARDQLTRKAKDVSMGKRPLSEIKDPRLNGNLNSVDFESILQIAVLCAAKSSKGRPTIDVVFDEMDKAWKNSVADMIAKGEMSSLATPQSISPEVVPV